MYKGDPIVLKSPQPGQHRRRTACGGSFRTMRRESLGLAALGNA